MRGYEDLLRSLTAERFRAPELDPSAALCGREPARAERAHDHVAIAEPRHAALSRLAPQDRLEARSATVEKMLLRVEKVAGLLDVKRPQIFALTKTGDVASVRLGGSRRMTTDPLHELLTRPVVLGAERLLATAPPAVLDRMEGEGLDKPLRALARCCRRRSGRRGPMLTRSLP